MLVFVLDTGILYLTSGQTQALCPSCQEGTSIQTMVTCGQKQESLECLRDILGKDPGSSPTSLWFVIIIEGQLWAELSVLCLSTNQLIVQLRCCLSQTQEKTPQFQ